MFGQLTGLLAWFSSFKFGSRGTELMHPKRRRRLYLIGWMFFGSACALGLALYALGNNVDLYYTPTQLKQAHISADHPIVRLGGMVKPASFKRSTTDLKSWFVLTDYQQEIPVTYEGILPALFREGQGIVVRGKLNQGGVLIASEVLAKHDEKYMPPGLK